MGQKQGNYFVKSGLNKESIDKLMKALDKHIKTISLALNVQIDYKIEEYMGSESDIKAIVEGISTILKGVGIQIGDVEKSVNALSEVVHRLVEVRNQQARNLSFSHTKERNNVNGTIYNFGEQPKPLPNEAEKEQQEFENSQRIKVTQAVIATTSNSNLTQTM